MKKRTTTRREDAEFLRRRLEDGSRPWCVGDACRPYRTNYGEAPDTRVARIEGDIVYLENGESMHRSKMIRAKGGA